MTSEEIKLHTRIWFRVDRQLEKINTLEVLFQPGGSLAIGFIDRDLKIGKYA